jgi:hypothetical protein
MWVRPQVHPCQKWHKDIPEYEIDSDYVDLLNMVQRHTRCSTSYCLRNKSNESELKCRFHFPFDHCPRTKLEFEGFIVKVIMYSTEQKLLLGEMIPD